MNAMELLTAPLAQAVGWALLHLLWQATIVAGILAATLALLKRHGANVRYAASCSALMLVFLMFVGTAYRAYEPPAPSAANKAQASTEQVVPLTHVPVLIAAAATESWREQLFTFAARAQRSLPVVVAIWLAGVVLLSSRLLVSWIQTRRLAQRDSVPASAQWQRVARRLSDALGLRRAVRLLESAAVEVPSVIGSLRPVILLPASTLTGMSPEQIEMVLAHELAHIRRHDFFVNLLQAMVETLMFYHPAVWWMSHRVRVERENCCDDLAVAVCGNPIQYARALARLEELRAHAPVISVAANGGSLLDRIRRIAIERAESTGSSSRWAAAVAMLSIVVIALAVPSLPALADRDAKKAKRAEAKVEVVAPTEADEPGEPTIYPSAPQAAEPGEPADPADPAEPDDADIDVEDVDIDDLDFPGTPAPTPAVAPRAPRMVIVPTPRPEAAPVAIPAFPVIAATPRPGRAPVAMALANLDAMDLQDLDDAADDAMDDVEDKPGKSERRIGDGKLTIDELISLRTMGVTPEYIEQMRKMHPDITLSELLSLRTHGIDADYIREMRSVFPGASIRDITALKIHGATAAYVKEMRSVFPTLTIRDAQSMRIHGLSDEYVREMRAIFPDASLKDLLSLRIHGVDSRYIRELRAIGVDIKKTGDAAGLKIHGVTVNWVKKLAEAGYANLSARELQRLAIAGVDEEFIRDMAKYRDKN